MNAPIPGPLGAPHNLLGLPIHSVTLDQAVQHIKACALANQRCFFSTPNLNFLVTAQTNEAFRRSVEQSDLSLADGMPLVWISKILGLPIRERVAGSDVFDALRKASGPPLKVYFYGGPPGAATLAMQAINAEKGAGLVCVGAQSPGYGSVEDLSSPETIASINQSGAQFLVVSLGAVKGQAWILHNLANLEVPVVSHLGAVVNFVAGEVSRAPAFMQKAGLEWLWRIKEEPSLWRRYAGDGAALLRLLVTRVLPALLARAIVKTGR